MPSVRNLGGVGVIADVNPADLPPNAFTSANNVRFAKGKVGRGIVAREYFDLTADEEERNIFSFPASAGGYTVVIPRTTGEVDHYNGGARTDVSVTGFTPIDSDLPWTHAYLSGISYLANKDLESPLWFDRAASTEYVELVDNDWPASTKAAIVRVYKDFLMMLNIQKGADDYPAMVKWPTPSDTGGLPTSWDETDPAELAGEKIFLEAKTAIRDALQLNDAFIIYMEDEAHEAVYIGGDDIFAWRRVFEGDGAISANCVVEVDKVHYVFGTNDIYRYDGVNKVSIVQDKVRDYLFSALRREDSDYCSVSVNKPLSEIYFNFPSNDGDTSYVGAPFCNRRLIFNYANGTCSFGDAHNSLGETIASTANVVTWADLPDWQDIGGSWASLAGEADGLALVELSRKNTTLGITSSRVVALDLLSNSMVARPLLDELLNRAWAKREGIDFDESGAPVNFYKMCTMIYPQALTEGFEMTFRFGSFDFPNSQTIWGDPISFDPDEEYQVPTREAGRYLSYEVSQEDGRDFSFSGFDYTVAITGKR